MDMTKSHQTVDTYYDGFGGGWRWGGGFGDATTSVDTYKVGTLVIDMFDAHTKKLIWRGSSSDTLSDKSDKNIKNLDKGVQKMFDHFPPGQEELSAARTSNKQRKLQYETYFNRAWHCSSWCLVIVRPRGFLIRSGYCATAPQAREQSPQAIAAAGSAHRTLPRWPDCADPVGRNLSGRKL